jgi:hypothetical protein
MKDEDLKFEEIETSHTLGGAGRCYTAVIHFKYIGPADLGRL